MKGSYCRKCKAYREIHENVDGECDPSGTKDGGAPREGDFGRESGRVQMEHDRCERVCRGALHLTPCDWKQYRQLRHQAEGQHDLSEGALVSPAGPEREDEHTKIIVGFCGPNWANVTGRRVTDFYRSVVKVGSRTGRVFFERSEDRRRRMFGLGCVFLIST